jgi:hypothetical protein
MYSLGVILIEMLHPEVLHVARELPTEIQNMQANKISEKLSTLQGPVIMVSCFFFLCFFFFLPNDYIKPTFLSHCIFSCFQVVPYLEQLVARDPLRRPTAKEILGKLGFQPRQL